MVRGHQTRRSESAAAVQSTLSLCLPFWNTQIRLGLSLCLMTLCLMPQIPSSHARMHAAGLLVTGAR